MITKFDSSYYGTVDMENLGYAGTPINDRRYSNKQLAGTLHKVVKYAEIFEEGVDIIFKAFEGKPFSHKGKYYTISPEVPYRGFTLKEITLLPVPARAAAE